MLNGKVVHKKPLQPDLSALKGYKRYETLIRIFITTNWGRNSVNWGNVKGAEWGKELRGLLGTSPPILNLLVFPREPGPKFQDSPLKG